MSDSPDIRRAMLDALAWQVELGADEAISEAPIDRFTASTPPTSQPAPTSAPARVTELSANARADARPRSGASPTIGDGSGASPTNLTAAGTNPTNTNALNAPTPLPDSPLALAPQALTLEQLATLMKDWPGSPLKETARNFVFADGLPSARLMVIGEAPGADEDRIGRPFVGRAGQLLDRMLSTIGIARTHETPETACYIANILPWRPPGNRTPTEQEVQAFLPFMTRHIELAKPDLIFAVGNTSVKALLDTTTGIKRLRGTWTRHPSLGVPVLPSFHPAYLLRQPADKRLAWRDLLSLRAVLDGAPPPF